MSLRRFLAPGLGRVSEINRLQCSQRERSPLDLALHDEALAGLGIGYESLTIKRRLGGMHVIALGSKGAPPAVFLPGANALNSTCLKWFL